MAKKKAEKHAAECEEEADAEELAMLKCERNAAREAEKHKSLRLPRSNSRSQSQLTKVAAELSIAMEQVEMFKGEGHDDLSKFGDCQV